MTMENGPETSSFRPLPTLRRPKHSSAAEPAAKNLATKHPAELERLRLRLSRTMLKTVTEYSLIEEGDRILVALSGGKDSYTMLDLLWRARRKAPVKFDILAFHLDQGQPGYDGEPLARWLEASGIPHRIHSEDTHSIVLDLSPDSSKSYCSPCSRLRRGILYTHAAKLGCNKIALGHHREDTLETLLLNLFFGGKLQAMPPKYRTQDGRFEVIRPLLECAEGTIAEHASLTGYPIIPCNLCGSQEGMKRERVGELLERLETEIPDVRQAMMGALKNVRPSHLLDGEVREAWDAMASRFAPRR